MSSFNGLEALQPDPQGLAKIDAFGSGPFLTAESLAGIRPVAGCLGAGLLGRNNVLIPIGCERYIFDSANICTFQGLTCSPPPPSPSPSPPLPPSPPRPSAALPATCPISIEASSVCGADASDTVVLTDYGNGTCVAVYLSSTPIFSSCDAPLFHRTCGALNASLAIYLEQGEASLPFTANVEKYLSKLGLGALEVIFGELSIYVSRIRTANGTIQPAFLASLLQSGTVTIRECEDCKVFPRQPPRQPVLAGVPGLRGLRQIYTPYSGLVSQGLNQLVFESTAFTDLSSFSGLACFPDGVGAFENPYLASFHGLGPSLAQSRQGLTVLAPGSGPFTTVDSLAGLQAIVGCQAVASSPATLEIPVGCNQTLTTSADVCKFAGTELPCRGNP
eukprot:jgi/Botrbrau1/9434/Bobra.0252s0058.1